MCQVAPIPEDIQDRRVEITGPVDRKMVINALNSGANVYMADFEDSNAPTWCASACFTLAIPLALPLNSSFLSAMRLIIALPMCIALVLAVKSFFS